MSLIGRLIKDSFKDLLIVNNDNAGVDETKRPVLDGEGTESALRLSTTDVEIAGNLNVTGITANAFNHTGEWSGASDYSKNSVVSYNNASYVSTGEITVPTLTLDETVSSEVTHTLKTSKNGAYAIRCGDDGVERFVAVYNIGNSPDFSEQIGQKIYVSTTNSASNHDFGVNVSVNDTGTSIAIGTRYYKFYIYDLVNGEWTQSLEGAWANNNTGAAVNVDISPDGLKMVTGYLGAGADYTGAYIRYQRSDTSSAWGASPSVSGNGVYTYFGMILFAFNDFMIVSAHGPYASSAGYVDLVGWDGVSKHTFGRPSGNSENRWGNYLACGYSSDGTFNVIVGNTSNNHYWYKWDNSTLNAQQVSYLPQQGTSTFYHNDNLFILSGSNISTYDEDVANSTFNLVRTDAIAQNFWAVGTYSGSNIPYVQNYDSSDPQAFRGITTLYEVLGQPPAPSDDPTAWKILGVHTGGGSSYVHPTGDGNLHVPATGTDSDGKVLTAGSTEGSLTWETPSLSYPQISQTQYSLNIGGWGGFELTGGTLTGTNPTALSSSALWYTRQGRTAILSGFFFFHNTTSVYTKVGGWGGNFSFNNPSDYVAEGVLSRIYPQKLDTSISTYATTGVGTAQLYGTLSNNTTVNDKSYLIDVSIDAMPAYGNNMSNGDRIRINTLSAIPSDVYVGKIYFNIQFLLSDDFM